MSQAEMPTEQDAPDGDLAIFTVAKVTSYRAVPLFTFYALATIIGAYAAQGKLQHRFKLRSLLGWYTMTVWEDEQALMTYVHRPAHKAAMRASRRLVAQHGIVRTRVHGSLKDLDWNEIFAQVDAAAAASGRPSRN